MTIQSTDEEFDMTKPRKCECMDKTEPEKGE